MKKTLLLLFIIAIGLSQTWKGGNTADYNANDICADRYLLHLPGTEFPDNTIEECCADTIASYVGLIEFFDSLSGDTLYITVNFDSDTIYIMADTGASVDTIVQIDTILVLGTGNSGLRFATHKEYVCDTVLAGIDTTTSPSDTQYCYFCDSILIVDWFMVSESNDTLHYDFWRVETGIDRDSCGILEDYGYVEGAITYITYEHYGDTIIYNIVEENNYYGCGWWAFDSLSGEYYFIDCGDTVNIASFMANSSFNNGIWVKSCDCETTYSYTSDSVAPFLSIDEAWITYYGNTERTENPSAAIDLIEGVTLGGDYAIQASSGYHNGYMQDIQDTIASLYGGAEILIGDGYLVGVYEYAFVDSIMFPDYTYNSAGFWSLWTRNINNSYFDTLENYGNVFTPPTLDYIPPYEGLANWLDRWQMPLAIADWPSGLGMPYDHLATSIRFERTVDLGEYFNTRDIDLFQATQPAWNIVQASDDFMPYISINGETFTLDTVQADAYSANVYTIYPTGIDYTQPIKIHTGVHSYASSIIGANMIIAIEYPEADSIPSCVWNYKDSLIVPPCTLMVSCNDSSDTVTWTLGRTNFLPSCGASDDCSDSICFFFPQGYGVKYWEGYRVLSDTVICFSTCDLDTLDLSASWANVEWLPFYSVSSDSSDTFEIAVYADSNVILDNDNDPLVILGDGGLKIGGDITIRNGQKLNILDNSSADTAKIYDDGDTTRFISDNPIKIGDGSITASNDSVFITGFFQADSLLNSNKIVTKYFEAESLKFSDLPTKYTDTILTIDGSGNVGYTLADSLGGGTTLLSYSENGTFANGQTCEGNNAICLGNNNAINSIFTDYSVISGGSSNEITAATNGDEANYCFIGGGYNNSIITGNNDGDVEYSIIVGGNSNIIQSSASNEVQIGCFIGGGYENQIIGNDSYSCILGGESNTINTAVDGHNTILGGESNSISGNATQALVGGYSNTYSGYYHGVILGSYNSYSGSFGFVYGQDVDLGNQNYVFAVGDSVYPYHFRLNVSDADSIDADIALQVNGGVYFEDSLSVGGGFVDTLISIIPVNKYHRMDTFNVTSDSTWTAVPFDTSITSETVENMVTWPVGSDSSAFLCTRNAILSIRTCAHFANNSGGPFSFLKVLSRVTVNSDEKRCLIDAFSSGGSFAGASEDGLSAYGTVNVSVGDTIRFELWSSTTTTDFINDENFDKSTAATIWMQWITAE